jgi:hypothetical protein
MKQLFLLCAFGVLLSGQQVRLHVGSNANASDPFGGPSWQADRYYQGGATAPGLSNSSDALNSKRYGDFSYAIPVADGKYTVSLWFVENVVGPGGRAFNVAINGAAALTNYDIAADTGMNTPVRKSFPAVATGGNGIRIQFATLKRSAAVNAIEVLPVPGSVAIDATPLAPIVTALSGPDACAPVKRPFSDELQPGGLLCAAPAPPAGVPLGASITDFNLGGVATAITPPDQTRVHGYSFPSPMSAANRYVGVTDPNGFHFALDRVTGAQIGVPGDSSAPIWDATDDNSFYYLNGVRIMRHQVQGNVDTVAVDFTGKLSQLKTGGSTHRSADNWLAVWSEADHQVCAVRLTDGKTACSDYLAAETRADQIPFGFIDYSIATDVDRGSGKRYVILMAVPALAIWSVDEAAGVLRFETRGPERLASDGFYQPNGNGDGICDAGENCLDAPHGDATSINGVQYFITLVDTSSSPCQRELAALPIAAGVNMVHQRITIAPFAYCSSAYNWPDFHAGCSPKTGACAISTTSDGPAPYGNQILLLQNLTSLVKLSFHHSQTVGADSYWYYPRAAISSDGRYLIYDSNMGRPDENGFSHEQVFLMRLPGR